MVTFTHPFILICIPIILFFWYFIGRDTLGYIAPNNLIKKYIKIPFSITILWIIRTFVVIFTIGLLAGPHGAYLFRDDGHNQVGTLIILDISRSMLANDILPDRISSAKDTIHTFLNHRKGDYIGIIVFAGKPFLSVPFTDDYAGIESIVKNITPYTIRQELPGLSGTAIGDALLLGLESFSGTTFSQKNILLITDGRANIGINPLETIDDLVKERITVYSLGIGTLTGGIIPGGGSYESPGGTGLDEELLQKIGKLTNGSYMHITDDVQFDESILTIEADVEKKGIGFIVQKERDLRLHFLICITIFVLLEYIIRQFISKKYKLL